MLDLTCPPFSVHFVKKIKLTRLVQQFPFEGKMELQRMLGILIHLLASAMQPPCNIPHMKYVVTLYIA